MELYHVYNRGVDKRIIFKDNRDRIRFVHSLYEFNDTASVNNLKLNFETKNIDSPLFTPRDRECLVEIHAWCLMDNHFHLLISECRERGLSEFTRKLGIGHTLYFNEKHKRSGVLFQGGTKKKLIQSDAHFLHMLHYIHLNPLDHLSGAKEWRHGTIKNDSEALAYLNTYRWSSYLDYCGKNNFPLILTTELFADVFRNVENRTKQFLKNMHFGDIAPLTFE